MEDDNKQILQELRIISKKLDTLSFLVLEQPNREGKMSQKDKVKLLNEVGLNYTQIANLLGKNPGSIAVQLTMLKKESLKKKAEDIQTSTLSPEAEVNNHE